MTTPAQYEAFETFLRQCRPALRRIAAHTRGDYTVDDIQGEAWVLAHDLHLAKGIEIAFEDPAYQHILLGRLYNSLVRYNSGRHMRYAVRLDHYRYDDESAPDEHPLLGRLASEAHDDPLSILVEQEDALQASMAEPEPHESRAAAYLYLLRRFDSSMKAVAQHLLISLSYCYYRYNEALLMARRQHVLASKAMRTPNAFTPRGWRAFQIKQLGRQRELDFDDASTRLFKD